MAPRVSSRPSAAGQAGGVRHGRRTEHPGRRGHEGARISVEPRVSSRTAACSSPSARPAADHPQRRARSAAGRRRAGRYCAGESGLARRGSRLHGRRAASAVRREPASSISPTRSRSTRSAGRSALARGRWDGQALTDVKRHLRGGRRQRHVAHRVRPRRHALHDDRPADDAAGSQQPGRQGAAAAATTAACRATTRSSGKRRLQAGGLHARPPQLARPGHASRHRRDVAERERPERRRRDQHPQARRATTAGRS